MPLTDSQKEIITATVPILASNGLTVTKHFYETLLAENPALRNLFSHSAQVSSHQATALAGALYAYANHINDLTPILPVVERICQKHASIGVTADQYTIVGEYLLRAMKEVLGEETFTEQVKDAWLAAYMQLAPLMASREETIAQEHESTTGGWRGWRNVRIAKKVPESKDGNIKSFYLESTDGQPLPTYKPGQYISVRVDVPNLGYKQVRQYSLSDAPPTSEPAVFRITPKRESGINVHDLSQIAHPGYVSNVLHDTLNTGDIIEISHPAGDFFLDEADAADSAPLVLISAGIGLTPLFSILKTSLALNSQRAASWVHVARSAAEDGMVDEITTLMASDPNATRVVFHSTPAAEEKRGVDYDVQGRLEMDALAERNVLFLGNKEATYYICGPNRFMNEIAAWLKARGVGAEKVKMEMFGAGK
ncbi:hypothetical protein H2198_007056 [Neophaeococcomyces mojaviensis]|uniref:Uncharacterized protein n=1 Tax=Neophaeococcomyces mojaviensis TaxID=3383035 RepID=A0ACC3A198_9EURO|nr:hypothetical protein H2198_007056 [Knufia sp. JES_112]